MQTRTEVNRAAELFAMVQSMAARRSAHEPICESLILVIADSNSDLTTIVPYHSEETTDGITLTSGTPFNEVKFVITTDVVTDFYDEVMDILSPTSGYPNAEDYVGQTREDYKRIFDRWLSIPHGAIPNKVIGLEIEYGEGYFEISRWLAVTDDNYLETLEPNFDVLEEITSNEPYEIE